MQIRILTESDARNYQILRLEALQTNPESYSSTYEKEIQYTTDMVKERIRPDQEKFVLGAFDEGSLVGVARYVREAGSKMKHRANIYGMYVSPVMRGRGVAKALLLEIINRAKKEDGVEQIHLQVVSTNVSAKKLYQSLGFETYGVEPNALKSNNQYYDEDFMVLFLN
ncbi:GNAT family N-acetyltransferase [Ureibacillus manganicus]|uniref:Acetyltransferase n=1 Tax=Ureibacillus manganicus DSM 26584 TaxID=1384049 RepID=A0A0A3HVK7_9BACL|nr:GNAT family N-acetyltransferase [Ureibacillus manganicus]KGR74323.1 acetyltransferase [Ureibacillus manganicus DSM 26584]